MFVTLVLRQPFSNEMGVGQQRLGLLGPCELSLSSHCFRFCSRLGGSLLKHRAAIIRPSVRECPAPTAAMIFIPRLSVVLHVRTIPLPTAGLLNSGTIRKRNGALRQYHGDIIVPGSAGLPISSHSSGILDARLGLCRYRMQTMSQWKTRRRDVH